MADKKSGAVEAVTNTEAKPEPKPEKQGVITFKMAGIDGDPDEVVTWEILPPADVAYYYLPEKNPTGASLPGVPLANLLAEQVEAYPKHIQNSIKGSAMYVSELPEPEKDNGKGGDK